MSVIRIANRYAKSILDLAAEQNDLDRVAADMAHLKVALENRDLFNLIKSPIISKGSKLEIFSKVFSGKISKLTDLFLQRVIRKGRESVIPEMVDSFNDQYNTMRGIVDVKLTTTPAITADALASVKSKIKSMVGDKQVNVQIVHDDSIIGGYIVEFGDKRYDASVKHQLENIKKTFSA